MSVNITTVVATVSAVNPGLAIIAGVHCCVQTRVETRHALSLRNDDIPITPGWCKNLDKVGIEIMDVLLEVRA